MHLTVAVIIWTVLIGAIVGALGRLVVPGKQNMSVLLTIGVGIVAAFVGWLIAAAIGVSSTDGINWIEHIIQVILAAIGVALVAGTSGRRSRV